MSTITIAARPASDEYAPYYGRYISLVSGEDVVAILGEQLPETLAMLSSLDDQKAEYRYEPGKWSVKEVVGHINDTERIMSYRALRIARNDKTPIEGYEQDDYVRDGGFGNRKLSSLVEELRQVRSATVCLFRELDPEAWTRRGTANKNEITARALAYVIAGHELHHRKILREKYLIG